MSTTLDSRVTFGMFIKNLGGKLQGIMAKSMSAEEKLSLILQEMSIDVQKKRVMARDIRSKMVALSDPDTAELEPIERMKARRTKLVEQGKKAVNDNKTDEANRLAKEIKSLDASLGSLESTYGTLKDSYELALENYKVSQAAYDHAKNNGESMLFAIKAHQDSLRMRDNAKSDKKSDISFLNDLEEELSKSQKELSSDKAIDRDLGVETKAEEEEPADESILAEFKK